MTLERNRKYYSPDEFLEIFKEQHRLFGPLDPMTIPNFEIAKETTIFDWRDSKDMLPWDELADYLNQEFRIKIPIKTWKTVLIPETEKTIWDLCQFLSSTVEKEEVKPIKVFGKECLSAAVFWTIKSNLKQKGAIVSELRPSTIIADFLKEDKNFSPLMEEVTMTGIRVFDKIEIGKLEKNRRVKYFFDKLLPIWTYKRPILTEEIITFRDLIQRIVERSEMSITLPKSYGQNNHSQEVRNS